MLDLYNIVGRTTAVYSRRDLLRVLYKASIYRVFNIEYCIERYIEHYSILVLRISKALEI